MAQISFTEERILDKEGKTIVVISADSIRKAFKKVKEDVNQLRNEIIESKQVLINQADVIRQILDKFEDITKIKSKLGELEAVLENKKQRLDDETKKLLLVMSDKINYLYERINKLEEENRNLKEENNYLKKAIKSLSKSVDLIRESKEEVY
ncbi:MAG TPA: hypothetical protein EYH54_03975 [Nautiliaceae bacterium]|nr:hypothetical protein [Nautiliaceae bacterium]